MIVTHAMVCGLFGSRAFDILYVSVDVRSSLVATGQLPHMQRSKRSAPDNDRMLNGRVPDKECIKRSNING